MRNRADDPVAEFADAVFRHAQRRLVRKGCSYADADDIAANLAERVLREPEKVLGRYASPERYVKACLNTSRTDYDRSQRSQRGQGSRTVHTADGDIAVRRVVLSLDAPVGDAGSPLEVPTAGWEDACLVRLDLEADLAAIDRTTVAVAQAIADGYTVVDAAAMSGLSRDQANRRLRAVRTREMAS